MQEDTSLPKPLEFVGSSLKDLKAFPEEVKDAIGFGLHEAQLGLMPRHAKVLHGFGSGVFEIIVNFDSDAYRAAYVVRFQGVVYVLHCFQKKSKKGDATPKPDLDLIEARFKLAEADYQQRQKP